MKSSQSSQSLLAIKVFITLALLMNIAFWFSVRDIRARWGNVPPVPEVKYSPVMGIGDQAFAYRMNGLMIQNLGDSGGRVTPLKDYDFERLTQWFFLQDALDPQSDYIPYLAAYYFSGVQVPEKYYPVLDYLKKVGSREGAERWRWLAQAVYVARFVMHDMDKALELAQLLAKVAPDDAPIWAKQMPVFVLKADGQRDAAYGLMVEILKANVDTMHPNEINASRAYICEQILTDDQRQSDPLCADLQ